MSLFIDLRQIPSGGFVADEPTIFDSTSGQRWSAPYFRQHIAGTQLVLVTHGFNVNTEHGITSLANWDLLCRLAQPRVYVGLLWPGDSQFFPVLDYPVEVPVARQSGDVLARFLNAHAAGAAGISMVSHSLGARAILQATLQLDRRVSVLILMASAIDNDCLRREYVLAADKADAIHVVASRSDAVLRFAFPVGNLLGRILLSGHPYLSVALGREGPDRYDGIGAPCTHWQIPDGWDYGHGDYMPGPQIEPAFATPLAVPAADEAPPRVTDHWKPSWAAGVIASEI